MSIRPQDVGRLFVDRLGTVWRVTAYQPEPTAQAVRLEDGYVLDAPAEGPDFRGFRPASEEEAAG